MPARKKNEAAPAFVPPMAALAVKELPEGHAAFLGLRTDKAAREVGREE